MISSTTARVIDPILAADSNDDCTLVWTSYGIGNPQILAARLPFGGVWTAPVVVYTVLNEILELSMCLQIISARPL